jgi:hypothetical protein
LEAVACAVHVAGEDYKSARNAQERLAESDGQARSKQTEERSFLLQGARPEYQNDRQCPDYYSRREELPAPIVFLGVRGAPVDVFLPQKVAEGCKQQDGYRADSSHRIRDPLRHAKLVAGARLRSCFQTIVVRGVRT